MQHLEVSCAVRHIYIYIIRRLRVNTRIRGVPKSACKLRHIRQSACIRAAPTGRISVKFDVGNMYENVLRKSKKFG